MTFFEQELAKFTDGFSEVVTVGNAVYLPLGPNNRLKIEFTAPHVSEHYDTLRLTALDKNSGRIDAIQLPLVDVLGKKQVSNPNFKEGVAPHVWVCDGKPSWYVYKPNAEDYTTVGDKIDSYAALFTELEMAQGYGAMQ